MPLNIQETSRTLREAFSLRDTLRVSNIAQLICQEQQIAELHEQRGANLIKRVMLLFLLNKIITVALQDQRIEKRYQNKRDLLMAAQRQEVRALETETAELVDRLKRNMEQGMADNNFTQIVQLGERARVTQEDSDQRKQALIARHQQVLDALAVEQTQQVDRVSYRDASQAERLTKVVSLSKKAALLGQLLQQQGGQVVAELETLSEIERRMTTRTQEQLQQAQAATNPKPIREKVLPAIFQPQPKDPNEWVRRKAIETKSLVTSQVVDRLLKAVGNGEIDTVENLLTQNPALLYAQGTVTDVAARTFPNVTVFQYALWASDIPMCDMLLKHFNKQHGKQHAANQMNALEHHRPDITNKYDTHFNFEETNAAYKTYCDNYDAWNAQQCSEYWCEKIGGVQITWPAWIRYKFTEEGGKVAWTEKNISKPYTRSAAARGYSTWSSEQGYTLGNPYGNQKGFARYRGLAGGVGMCRLMGMVRIVYGVDRECLNKEQSEVVRYRETLRANFAELSHENRQITSNAPA